MMIMNVRKHIRLGNVILTNVASYSLKEEWSYVNYLDTGNITENSIAGIQLINLNTEKLPSRARRKVKYNSIIYSTVRPNQRHFGIIKELPENFLVSTGFVVIDVCQEMVDADYLYFWLSQDNIVELLHTIAEQSVSTYPSIKASDIENLEIDLPPIEEQKKIASVLLGLLRKMAHNVAINDNLQQQAMALYEKFFPYAVTDKLPAGWRVGTVGEIVEIHDSKRIPLSSTQRAKMEKRIYPYYGAASLMDYVDEYIFDGKYLLLGEDGTVVDNAGYPILQYVYGKFWVNNHAHILTGCLGHSVESLLLLFRHTSVKSIVTGAVQPKISQANLRSIQVVIPPHNEMDTFNKLICPLFDQIRQNQDQNKALMILRDTLLPRLMSGEIDISNIQL